MNKMISLSKPQFSLLQMWIIMCVLLSYRDFCEAQVKSLQPHTNLGGIIIIIIFITIIEDHRQELYLKIMLQTGHSLGQLHKV